MEYAACRSVCGARGGCAVCWSLLEVMRCLCSVQEVVDGVLHLLEALTVMSYILLCALYAEGPGGRTLGYVLEPLEMMYSVLELGEAMR